MSGHISRVNYNIVTISCQPLERFLFCEGSHFVISHRKARSPLLGCCTTVQLVIMLRCVDIAVRHKHKLYLADLHCGRHHISINAALIVFTSLFFTLLVINIF